MDDRDGKKPFIIPKTHTSTKDVLITEKSDSRNVIELFNDIKSCALEVHFDFRQHACKSCDTIRNQKLQKLYNEKRIKMKKDQDPIERLAFHLITYRDVALTVANDGLRCEQLSFSCEKYLGNPKDGIHLSRRPDVLLTSSGAQGLYRFGLLVCKILLGKGYATIPSINNKQLSAQLHYDHHFCKIQSINKDQQNIDDLLANSLIFCYEHENFEAISHPTQILPIAILWYDLVDRFPPELSPIINHESQHRTAKKSKKTKPLNINQTNDSIHSNKPVVSNSTAAATWETPPSEVTPNNANSSESNPTKYPSHFLVPLHRIYSTPNPMLSINLEPPPPPPLLPVNSIQQISNCRDPRLARTKRETVSTSSETIPLSPQHLLTERSLSDGSLTTKTRRNSLDEPNPFTKIFSTISIPLHSSTALLDPRLKTLKPTKFIFYLEFQAVKHALQQQKRLNHYYESKNGLPPKTSYYPIPLSKREVSNEEYERLKNDQTCKLNKHSNGIDYSSLYISVIDCFHFGLIKPSNSNQMYIDLEQLENKFAYEQIEISNDLIQREKQINSQQMRLRFREKRQRRIQQQINEKQTVTPLPNSKMYITTGRQLLKEYQTNNLTNNTHISTDLLDFFSREYKNENRPYVKHLLAELAGVFIEKYQIKQEKTNENHQQNGTSNHHSIEEPIVDDQGMNCVIDMDLDSPSPTDMRDHDERFPVNTPPPLPPPMSLPPLPPLTEMIYTQPVPSLVLSHTLLNEPYKLFNDQNFNDGCQKLVEQLKEYHLKKSDSRIDSEKDLRNEETAVQVCHEQLESSSSIEASLTENNNISLTIDDNAQDEEENLSLPLVSDDANQSLNEFVKLLTKEASTSKSSSPAKKANNNGNKRSLDYSRCRRRSHDDHDDNHRRRTSSSSHFNSPPRYTRPCPRKIPYSKSPPKKMSTNRTVLISDHSSITMSRSKTDLSTDSQLDIQDEPKQKRLKIDLISPLLPSDVSDKLEDKQKLDSKDLTLKSLATTSVYHDEKRRSGTMNDSHVSSIETSKSRSSRSRSRSHSKSRSHHRDRSRQSSTTKSTDRSKSNEKSNKYSHSSSSSSSLSSSSSISLSKTTSHHDQSHHERTRSSDLSSRHYKLYSTSLSDRYELSTDTSYRSSLTSVYQQRNIRDTTLSSSLHHQQPSRHKRFNYNHLSVADHPRFANPNALSSSRSTVDFNYPSSSSSPAPPSTHLHHGMSTAPVVDQNIHSPYYQNKYHDQLKSSSVNNFDSKPSKTFEYLQMILQNNK